MQSDHATLDWATADRLAATHGESFYLLDLPRLRTNVERWREAFRGAYPRTALAYSFKTNHLPAICREVIELGMHAQVDSDMGWWLAKRLNVPGSRIVFNGPCRSPRVLAEALRAGAVLNLNSGRDLEVVREVLPEVMRGPDLVGEVPVGLRVSFPLVDQACGRLGVDVDSDALCAIVAGIRSTPGLRLAGLHFHFPNRSVSSFGVRAARMVELADRLIPSGPDYLDLGGSLYGGVPRVPEVARGDSWPTPENYADAISGPLQAAYGAGSDSPLLYLEPGTAIVASAQQLVTLVVDTSPGSGGGGVATVDASILHTSPNMRRSDFPISVLPHSGESRCPVDQARIFGGSMFEHDQMGRARDVAAGDFLVFDNVGAYSLSMSPTFTCPNLAVLAYPAGWSGGSFDVLRPAGTPAEVFGPLN